MQDNIKELLGSKIRERRIYLNKTQEELGSYLHVKKQTISKWEKGINEPGAEELRILSDILECSIDYLLGKVDSPTTPCIVYEDTERRHIELERGNYPYQLTTDEVEEMIQTLKKYHVDVEAVIKDIRKNKN